MTDFNLLTLSPALLRGLEALNHTTMTPVQAASVPPILEGRDVIAQARTGSGKTAAFALGFLDRIDLGSIGVQALVLCPTRELADQVGKEIRRLASFLPNLKLLTLCGGIPLRPQLASLTHPPHIVVGTPGRVQELIDLGALDLGAVKVLVLDEADRMLDMGFGDAITQLAGRLPKPRQTLLFSATFAEGIRSISKRLQRDPVEVTVDSGSDSDDVEQLFFEVDTQRRLDALATLLITKRPESALVFCNTRRDTKDVAEQLHLRGFSVLALHGDLDQREREEMLVRFANRSCQVLVATDVAARGLDIDDLAAVINWELPTDADTHVHRSGRTARAGRKGLVLNLVAPAEMPRMGMIESALGSKPKWVQLQRADRDDAAPSEARMATVAIDGGRQDKLRPGDILGALTGEAGLTADQIGKIAIFPTRSYVAIRSDLRERAMRQLRDGKIKGRKFRVRKLD
ncbi:MAG: ATP-dependent RNA helicase DbpA [Dokdonella sp.]